MLYVSSFSFDRGDFLGPFAAEAPENDGGDFLLSNDFIRYCVSKFSVPSRGLEANSRTFQQKHLNIVDPLKQNNNLGRSVSKGTINSVFRVVITFNFVYSVFCQTIAC